MSLNPLGLGTFTLISCFFIENCLKKPQNRLKFCKIYFFIEEFPSKIH